MPNKEHIRFFTDNMSDLAFRPYERRFATLALALTMTVMSLWSLLGSSRPVKEDKHSSPDEQN